MRWKCFLTFSDQIFTEVEQSNMKNFLTFSDQIFMEVVLVSSVEQEEGWGVKALCWTLSGSFHSWIIGNLIGGIGSRGGRCSLFLTMRCF